MRCADAEINDDLVPAGLDLPGSPVMPTDLAADNGLLAEQYYAAVPGHDPFRISNESAGWLDCGSGADGMPRPWDAAGGPRLAPSQARLLARQVAQDCIRHGREAGNVPAGLLRWAEEILEPAVDWRKALAAELRRAVADTAGAVDYSYRRPSRRASVAGSVVLPALRRPVPQIAVVCDTSGSMSEDLLAAALAEVEGLLRAVGMARQLRVLACDTAVGPVRRVSSARQVELVGGGGTDMEPASRPRACFGRGPRSPSCSPTGSPPGRTTRRGACGSWLACSAMTRRTPGLGRAVRVPAG